MKTTKTKTVKKQTVELVPNLYMESLERKIDQFVQKHQSLSEECEMLRKQIQFTQSGSTETLGAKTKELETKDDIIRRQQQLIKSKDAAVQELQIAYNSQRKEIEELNEETSRLRDQVGQLKSGFESSQAMLAEETRQRVRQHIESAMNRLDKLERAIQNNDRSFEHTEETVTEE